MLWTGVLITFLANQHVRPCSKSHTLMMHERPAKGGRHELVRQAPLRPHPTIYLPMSLCKTTAISLAQDPTDACYHNIQSSPQE
jgi:hypothetical protein